MSLAQAFGQAKGGIWQRCQLMLLAAAFASSQAIPAPGLAFAQDISAHDSLLFAIDPELPASAIMAAEIWPTVENAVSRGRLLLPVSPHDIAAGNTIKIVATAYSSTADQTDADPFRTASGSMVKNGTLAANFLPFGARVKIDGNLYVVEDRLNHRYDNKSIVDIWKPSREQALVFGVRYLDMEIVSLP